MSTILDSRGKRIIIRHRGPAGRGIPTGGTTGQILAKTSDDDFQAVWVNPPDGVDGVVSSASSAADNELVVFDSTTGKLVKNSSVLLSEVARTNQLDLKVDKVAGKGLSANDFTSILKNKLENLYPVNYRGAFNDITALNAEVFSELNEGDFAFVWDTVNILVYWFYSGQWRLNNTAPLSGADIAALIFNGTVPWDFDECVVFTEDDRTKLEGAVTQEELQVLAQQAGIVAPSYASLSFFNAASPYTVDIVSSSDGTNNFVAVDAPSTVASALSGFSNGGSDNGKLHYIAAQTPRVIKVSGNISVSCANSDRVVVAIFRNGTALESQSRSVAEVKAANQVSNIAFETFVSIATSDFIEVRVANLDSSADVAVHSMSLDAISL
jgi:hypothetical protein